MWQDLIFSIGSWIFTIALIPSIISKDKPNRITCFMTAIILVVFSYTYYTMGLLLGALSSFVTALCWVILFVQKR